VSLKNLSRLIVLSLLLSGVSPSVAQNPELKPEPEAPSNSPSPVEPENRAVPEKPVEREKPAESTPEPRVVPEKQPQPIAPIEFKNDGKKDEGDRRIPRYFSINPGFVLESTTVDITGPGGNATMTQRGPGQLNFMLDVKSRDYQISENSGIHLMIHAGNFRLNNQFADPPPGASSDSSSSSGTSSTPGSTDNRVKQDLGTRMTGYYSYILPAFYFGKANNPDSFRMGLGVGPGAMTLSGTVRYNDTASPGYTLGFNSITSTRSQLQYLSAFMFSSGSVDFHSDPALSYLIATMDQGTNLQTLGAYMIGNNLMHPSSNDLILSALLAPSSLNRAHYSFLEILTITALSRGFLNVSAKNLFTFMFFFETPSFGFLKFRVAFGGPLFSYNGIRYEFRTFEISAFAPIAI